MALDPESRVSTAHAFTETPFAIPGGVFYSGL